MWVEWKWDQTFSATTDQRGQRPKRYFCVPATVELHKRKGKAKRECRAPLSRSWRVQNSKKAAVAVHSFGFKENHADTYRVASRFQNTDEPRIRSRARAQLFAVVISSGFYVPGWHTRVACIAHDVNVWNSIRLWCMGTGWRMRFELNLVECVNIYGCRIKTLQCVLLLSFNGVAVVNTVPSLLLLVFSIYCRCNRCVIILGNLILFFLFLLYRPNYIKKYSVEIVCNKNTI